MNRYDSDPLWTVLLELFDAIVSGDPHIAGPTTDYRMNLAVAVLDALDAMDA
jgi:hypothetical protein